MENLHEGHRKRLRARYAASGAVGFEDHELLELLLTYAIPRRDVNATAHRLLTRFGSLSGVLSASREELRNVEGLGESAAVFLSLEKDILSRLSLEGLRGNKHTLTFDSTETAARYAHTVLSMEQNECCHLFLLDAKRVLLADKRIGTGTLDAVEAWPRVAAEAALTAHAKYAVLAHVHPSGDPAPSQSDNLVTQSVQRALESIETVLLDHLIVGRSAVFSFALGQTVPIHTDGLLPTQS